MSAVSFCSANVLMCRNDLDSGREQFRTDSPRVLCHYRTGGIWSEAFALNANAHKSTRSRGVKYL